MLRCQFLCHVLKTLFFIKIALKLSYFFKKMQNFRALEARPPDPPASGGWGLCPQTPRFQQLGALPPTPIGLWQLGSPLPDPKSAPPHCEFLATRLNRFRENQTSRSSKVIYKNEIVFPLYFKSSEFLINSSTF